MNVLQRVELVLSELAGDRVKSMPAGQFLIYVGGSRNVYYEVLRVLRDFGIVRIVDRRGRILWFDWAAAKRFAEKFLSKDAQREINSCYEEIVLGSARQEARSVLEEIKEAKPVEASA